MDFREQVLSTIEKYKMLEAKDHVLVAVSGGPDSMAMLYALVSSAAELDIKISMFHLNHKLRLEADGEAQKVRAVSEILGLNLFGAEYDVRGFCAQNKLSIQEGARLTRYRLLDEISEKNGINKIAVGHHANDVVETFVMRVIRGAGLTGMSSIPPVRGEKIIRPLIEIGKTRILEFLAKEGIGFVSDSSNLNSKYFRNKVRLEVIPELKKLNPQFDKRVLATVGLIRDEEEIIDRLADEGFARAGRFRDNEVEISVEKLISEGPALGRRIIRKALVLLETDLAALDHSHLEAAWALVGDKGGSVDVPGKIRIAREGGSLVAFLFPYRTLPEMALALGQKTKIDHRSFSVTIKPVSKVKVEVGSGKQRVHLDSRKLTWPLSARSAVPGDRFQPMGLMGHKKVQDFFVDAKIPRRHRGSIPVFTDKKGIIAVGSRPDEEFKVSDTTADVLVIKWQSEFKGSGC